FADHCSRFVGPSPPNDLVLIGGQSPTVRIPPRSTPPHWDMQSIFGHAEDHGVAWRAYTGAGHYPVHFYTQLRASSNVVATQRFVADAAAGDLPPLVYVWHPPPQDEHPPADVTRGMDVIWRCVDAVVRGGGWEQ